MIQKNSSCASDTIKTKLRAFSVVKVKLWNGQEVETMNSVLSEIIRLRCGRTPVIDYHNSNRYCIVVSEDNGTKTAYCLGVPIYNSRTKVQMRGLRQEMKSSLRIKTAFAEFTFREILCQDSDIAYDTEWRLLFPR